jgi:5-methylcytosine-specific restriction endonuclease McrA
VGLVAVADALRRALTDFDPARHSGDDCAAIVEELARTEKACAVARARAAARVADCGGQRVRGFRDAVDWLARVSGTSSGEAERDLRTARRLDDMPATRAASASGALSLGQADEIARTERECPGAEREMLVLAQRHSLRALRDEGRKKRLGAIGAEDLARRQRAARSFRHWRDDLGMVRFNGALEPHVGVPFVSRLDAETDRVRREAPRAERLATPWECSAADAFARLIAGAGWRPGIRAEVVYVWDLSRRAGHIVGGGPVPESQVAKAAREASIKAVLHDGTNITTVAHYGKTMPAHLRTALLLGRPPDFEGPSCADCGNRFHLEWDHVNPRANGGAWSIDNNEPRCWPCHTEKTERDRRAGLLHAAHVDDG